MEILIELIGAVLEEVFGLTLESGRVPRIVKTVLVSLLCVPLAVVCIIIMITGIRDGDGTKALVGGLVAALMLTAGAVLVRRIWKR